MNNIETGKEREGDREAEKEEGSCNNISIFFSLLFQFLFLRRRPLPSFFFFLLLYFFSVRFLIFCKMTANPVVLEILVNPHLSLCTRGCTTRFRFMSFLLLVSQWVYKRLTVFHETPNFTRSFRYMENVLREEGIQYQFLPHTVLTL